MPRRVMASIRRTSPLARARPGSPASRWWSLSRQMIRSPAEACGAVGDPDGPAVVDQAEVDQVVADPGGQLAAAGPVRGHQQDVAPGQVGGDVGAGGLVDGVVGRGAADAAVLVVLIQRGGVTLAEAEGGGAFPGGGEPDGFGELDVAEPVREEHHGAAAFDRGELFLVSRRGSACSRCGPRTAVMAARWVMEIMEPSSATISEPGGIWPRWMAASSRVVLTATRIPACAETVGGVLGGGGAEDRAVPGPGDGGQDAGLAGAGRAGDHLDGAGRGERVPGGGGLVQAQPARRGVLARVVRVAGQFRA